MAKFGFLVINGIITHFPLIKDWIRPCYIDGIIIWYIFWFMTSFWLKNFRIFQKVRHPFVVEFIDSMSSHRSVYLITELVRGGDLYDFITETEDYCPRQVFQISWKFLNFSFEFFNMIFRHANLPITWLQRCTTYTLSE